MAAIGSILSVGCSPYSAFLSWRLEASQSYNVSIAWKEISTAVPENDGPGLYPQQASRRSFSIKSARFGGPSASLFTPETIYDASRLDLVNPSTPYDFVLFSPSSLKTLSSFHRSVSSNIVLPNHTIILVDSTCYVGLHSMIASRFPDNPVCAITTEAQVRMVPPADPQGYSFNSSDPLLLLLHTGESTKTVISPLSSRFSDTSFQHRLRSLALSLQTAGIDASVSSSYNQFQWHQVIPFVAFQPLSIILEASTPKSLINNVLSKPLFSGIISELMSLARKHSDCKFSPDYMSTIISNFLESYSASSTFPQGASKAATFTTSSSPPSSSSSSSSLTYSMANPLYCDAPVLFYNYYHLLPVHPDLLLLQPILLADDYGIKTPYLESAFAFLSQLVFYNTSSNSVFLNRITEKKKTPNPEPSFVPDGALSDRMKNLDLKEKTLEEREQILEGRELKLSQWSSSLQRQQQQQQQQQQQPPIPPQHMQGGPSYPPSGPQRPGYGPNPGYMPMKQRPMSAMPSMMRMAPPMENPEAIDMMYLTSRRNRRSVGGRMRSSNSSASLANMGSTHGSFSQYPNPALSRQSGRASVTESMIMEATGMDGLSSITSNRYGAVDSSALSKSRSNSLTIESLMARSAGPNNNRYSQSISSPALFKDHFSPHLQDPNFSGSYTPAMNGGGLSRHPSTVDSGDGFDPTAAGMMNGGAYFNGGYARTQRNSVARGSSPHSQPQYQASQHPQQYQQQPYQQSAPYINGGSGDMNGGTKLGRRNSVTPPGVGGNNITDYDNTNGGDNVNDNNNNNNDNYYYNNPSTINSNSNNNAASTSSTITSTSTITATQNNSSANGNAYANSNGNTNSNSNGSADGINAYVNPYQFPTNPYTTAAK